MTDDELRRRIELARVVQSGYQESGPWPWPTAAQTKFAHGFTDDTAAHIAANSPDAVVALCTELLSAREEIRTLVERLINAGDPP